MALNPAPFTADNAIGWFGMNRMRSHGKALAVALLVPLATCDQNPTAASLDPVGFSRAYDRWQPAPGDTCSAEVHNSYSVVGPDGKLYPTWHPVIDPATGCTFGHEHGRDPRGSDLHSWLGELAFGHANEMLDVWDPDGIRHEDHVGHKVEWENDIRLDFAGGAGAVLEVTCDVFTKMHQGSHSKDAFTNNVHEITYAIRCNDDTEMRITALTAIGTPGEFVASCDRDRHVAVGPPTPLNSPSGGGKRAIPDRSCVEQFLLVLPGSQSNYQQALHESWETHTTIRRADGRTLASFDPYFQVFFPSRFHDPSEPGVVGRPIDVCYEVAAGNRRVRGGECESSTASGAVAGIDFDDPRSLFNGVKRQVDINGNRVTNADGPEVWYTDPYGRNARTEPFPGSVRQYIARVDNSARVGHGPVIGRSRTYGGPTVHAPN